MSKSWFILAVVVSVAGAPLPGADSSSPRRGFAVHDPSTIVSCNGEYWLFATGMGIISRHSSDLRNWTAGPTVFTNSPAWTKDAVPGNRGHLWAPDIIKLNDRFFLYYSVSTWGSRDSAIGLVTASTLDPTAKNYGWTDCGPVIQSSSKGDFNAIDPSVLLDHAGRLWLTFGSYWSGIKVVQLDARTGLRCDTNAPISLAWKDAIEAPCLYQHGDDFYLFVNWGQCCRGTNSTYNIRVGRSRNVAGPYIDKEGVDMMSGGGSLLLETAGRYIGPGHAGILVRGSTNWLSFHYYDAETRGLAKLGLRQLEWGKDGWPKVHFSDPAEDFERDKATNRKDPE